jgi:DNA-binding MarR family transcriptional regulator
MHITPASTTRAVNCLADKKLVERVKDDDDQRSIQVQVTTDGRARYEEISGKIQRGMNLMLSEFTIEEQVQLADYLERFVAAVDKLAASTDGD